MFMIGLVMLASSALLPPLSAESRRLFGHAKPACLMAPRGVGTMIAMVLAGRLAMRFDPRYLMGGGMVLLLWSMWEMSRWTPDIATWWLVVTTFVQGIGMGLVFVPMNLVAFATLSPHYRTDGAALVNLMRNVGSAIGISITTTVLCDEHADRACANGRTRANPFNRTLAAKCAQHDVESADAFRHCKASIR